MKKHVQYLGVFAALLLILTIVNVLTNGSLSHLGIYPRSATGLIGVFLSPFIHSGWQHFFSNIISFSVLSVFLFQFGEKRFYRVLAVSWLLTGLSVWLLARDAYHVGLSGVIYALWSYLLIYGVMRRSVKSMLISFLILIFYGSMVFGVFPGQARISFESHLFGAIVGGYFGWRYARKDKRMADRVVG
ncbi:rhomboid family intramembrane serine protease [Thaumasiovibrio subtropicus]|uniref:rhomboid family intramembrane serine protease n=1 Tax=Thaumasiovibrio subtropicus TaxID=1891207 RepID=UPI00131BA8B7|nr:rhomboid family intramembrane serine protease [Thaumasiovibrio subtropicus]